MRPLVRGKRRTTKADAIQYAYRLLSYRGRSKKELKERLGRKGFPDEVTDEAIDFLDKKGFIDDASLALSLKRTAEETKLLGSTGVRLFLRRRGIPEEIIGDVFRDSDTDEIARAKKLAEKKLRTLGDFSDNPVRRKLWRFLTGKGYSFDTIRRLFKKLGIEEDEE